MVVTTEQVTDEIMKLRDIAGNLCYKTRAEVKRYYGLAAIANACTERSIEPSQYSRTFWDLVDRYGY